MRKPGLKRVLLTGDTAGGVWTFTLELAAGLIENGLDVLLATFGPAVTCEHISAASKVQGLRWFHHKSKLEWMPDPWRDIDEAGKWLVHLAERENVELVHMNTLCHADLGWNIPVITTVHSCVSSWWKAVHQSPVPHYWNRYLERVESSLQASSLVVAPSKAALDTIPEHYDLDACESIVIPNGRSGDLFRRSRKKPMIFSVGRLWDEAKNVSALASLAPHLEWPVYLAGETDRPLSDCRMLGQLGTRDLSAWYAKASIYVSPAKYEPFGLSILEAALSGCALVLNNIPSLVENWSGAAVFCEPHELKPVLQELMQNSAWRKHLAKRALERSAYFTQSRMVANYMDAYQFALGKSSARVVRHACAS